VDDAHVARLGEQLARYFEAYAPVDGIHELLADLSARGFKQAWCRIGRLPLSPLSSITTSRDTSP
jgi:beta-phosphoglucomutase-like phosphatase (HAD superfamily)